MITKFLELKLPEALQAALVKGGFEIPTPIQVEAIPIALEGRDIIASAQTGTGKTLAFVLPILAKLINDEESQALIMVPTRELATQVASVIDKILGQEILIDIAVLIGGDSMEKQLRQLKRKPRIVVGTPGRINDHLQRRKLNLSKSNFLVLDETDRMLDMGFSVQIETIIEKMREERQTLMFSATLNKNILKISEFYLNNPVKIEIKADHSNMLKIKQEFHHLPESDKFTKLLLELEERSGSVVLFVATKRKVEKIAAQLAKANHSVNYIHGDLKQRQRDAVIKKFRDYDFTILVATDVAARGLDIPHIEHVVNYDLPHQAEDYVHRIGRTGRAGAEGSSISLISPEDRKYWRELQRFLDPDAPEERDPRDAKRGGGRSRGNSSSRPSGFKRRSGGSAQKAPSSSRGGERNSAPRDFDFRNKAPRGDRSERSSATRSGGERSFAPRTGGDRSERSSERSFSPRSERPTPRGERNSAPRDFDFKKSAPRGDRSERSSFPKSNADRPAPRSRDFASKSSAPRSGGDKPLVRSAKPRAGAPGTRGK